MGLAELRELHLMPPMWPHDCDHLHDDTYYGPNLAFESTFELMEHIPEREWAIPTAFASKYNDRVWPTKFNAETGEFERVPTNDVYWREYVDGLIVPWIKFLNKIEKHMRAAEKLRTQVVGMKRIEITLGDFTPDDYDELRTVIGEKVKEEETGKYVASTKRAFAALLGLDARTKLGFTRMPKVESEDEANARFLVERLNDRRGGLPLGYVR